MLESALVSESIRSKSVLRPQIPGLSLLIQNEHHTYNYTQCLSILEIIPGETVKIANQIFEQKERFIVYIWHHGKN